jgi:glycosyltransferase involved in cell wall biosynthesis
VSWSHKVKQVSSIPLFVRTDYRLSIPYFDGIKQNLDRYQPDLIHVVSPSLLGLYGLKYARHRQIKAVTSYHTHFVDYFDYYGLKRYEPIGWSYLRWFYNQFDRVYVPTPNVREELNHRGFRSIELWQRGVNLDTFSPQYRSHEIRKSIQAEDKPIILFVSRLVKEKNVEDLIATNQIMNDKRIDFKMVIVGEGPVRKEMEKAMPKATFTGHLSGQALSEWYASADIFLFPSTTETFGNVVLEAFASGLPVVCVDKGGSQDLVSSGVDGFITRSNDPHDMVKKIEILLKDKTKYRQFRLNAIEKSRKYCWDTINCQLIESYENVLINRN